MLRRPIPHEARPVARLIQKLVPRPTPEDLQPDVLQHSIRLHDRVRGRNFCCPLGLLPDANVPTPTHILNVFPHHTVKSLKHSPLFGFEREHYQHRDYPTIDQSAIAMFALWWDRERDPEAAIAAVWDLPEDEEE